MGDVDEGEGSPIRDLREHMQSLTGTQFEYFLADLWRLQGFDAMVTQQSADQGVDVVATRPESDGRLLIQAKCYAAGRKVRAGEVRDFVGTPVRGDEYLLATTGKFTTNAKAVAFDRDEPIELEGADDLAIIVRDIGAESLLDEYLANDGEIPSQERLDSFSPESVEHQESEPDTHTDTVDRQPGDDQTSLSRDPTAVPGVDPNQVAEFCGIKIDRAAIERLPMRQYRDHEEVHCQKCGQIADPPWRVVANLDGVVQCHECFGRDAPYADLEGQVLALLKAGWTSTQMKQFSPGSPLGSDASNAPELVRRVREKHPRL